MKCYENATGFINASEMLDELFADLDPIDLACDDLIFDVANALFEVRYTDMKMSFEEAASRTGISQDYIENLEACEHDPRLSEIARYLALLAPDKKIKIVIE